MLLSLLVSTALAQDADGDGFDASVDCNDADPAVGLAPRWYLDEDGDGYGSDDLTVIDCIPPAGHAPQGGDCDDTNPFVNPDAREICSPTDFDCDGDPLGGLPHLGLWEDRDNDTYGAGEPLFGCPVDPSLPEPQGTYLVPQDDGSAALVIGVVENDLDCDDTDAWISPVAQELCDGIDNDCDGGVDEPDASDAPVWFEDGDGDGYGDHQPVPSCEPLDGHVLRSGDCGDGDPEVHPDGKERCDGVDNDCDGEVDEGGDDAIQWFADDDGDGLGDPTRERWSCDPPPNAVFNADDENDRVFDYPGGGCATVPGTALGPALLALLLLAGARPASAQDADGDGWDVADGDCRDDLPDVHPGATEICNAYDDDCDGDTNEGVGTAMWPDNDLDGFGGATAEAHRFCSPPGGSYVENNLDCNDFNANISPAAAEVCDSLDNDCNGLIDDTTTYGAVWFRDQDGDGFGSDTDTIMGCEQPEGYLAVGGDCNDRDWLSHPDGVEVCDGRDNDCDGFFDEGAEDAWTWWHDEDGDGLGDPDSEERTCHVPDDAVFNDKDLDDASPAGQAGCASAGGPPLLRVVGTFRRR